MEILAILKGSMVFVLCKKSQENCLFTENIFIFDTLLFFNHEVLLENKHRRKELLYGRKDRYIPMNKKKSFLMSAEHCF